LIWLLVSIPSGLPTTSSRTRPRRRLCRLSLIFLVSHAGCAGFWVSGPGDLPGTPEHYKLGLQQDVNGSRPVHGWWTLSVASGHKFSSGSHAEGRICAKSALAYILDHPDYKPTPKMSLDEIAAELYLPFEIYEKYKTYSTDPTIIRTTSDQRHFS